MHRFGLGGGIRALVVATRGETDPSPALWVDEASATSIRGVEDPFRRGVWLDEVTGAYRIEMIHDGEPAGQIRPVEQVHPSIRAARGGVAFATDHRVGGIIKGKGRHRREW